MSTKLVIVKVLKTVRLPLSEEVYLIAFESVIFAQNF